MAIESDLHQTFCSQLKAWRLAKHVSQSELARRIGIKPSMVCQLESGRNTPNLDTVDKIAKALKVRVNHFLFLDPSEVSEPEEALA